MNPEVLLPELRGQPFYQGQILRVTREAGQCATAVALEAIGERIPRLGGGSLPRLLNTLGHNSVYASLVAGLSKAFTDPTRSGETEDAVLIGPVGPCRELFWRLTALLDALDESRLCLVVCPTAATAESAHEAIQALIRDADVTYAVRAALLKGPADLANLQSDFPLIVVASPEILRALLLSPDVWSCREWLLSLLGRVVLPDLEQLTPAIASNSAYLFRQLHVECLARSMRPAFNATAADAPNVEAFTQELWGRPLGGADFIRSDSAEAPPITFIHYLPPMVSSPGGDGHWVRAEPIPSAQRLIEWLVGPYEPEPAADRCGELHYVIDISGSMCGDPLDQVKAAVRADLQARIDKQTLREGDHLKVTSFHTEAQCVFDEAFFGDTPPKFEIALNAIECTGGTDIATGLEFALQSAVATDAKDIRVLLFSDGYSDVSVDQKRTLIEMSRKLRSDGRDLHLLYVILDMQPPADVRNLIAQMGGRIVRESVKGLVQHATQEGGLEGEEAPGAIVFLDGESGLGPVVTQLGRAGKRQLLPARNLGALASKPRSVEAIVTSGRYCSLAHLRAQVKHFGRAALPVFILTDADAHAQLLLGDHENVQLGSPALLIRSQNPYVAWRRLADILAVGPVERHVLEYLCEGHGRFDAMAAAMGPSPHRETTPAPQPLPPGFVAADETGRRITIAPDLARPDALLTTFTEAAVPLAGNGAPSLVDASLVPIVFHKGAWIDTGENAGEVVMATESSVTLGSKSSHRAFPILGDATVGFPEGQPTSPARDVANLGPVAWGQVLFRGQVRGTVVHAHANLDAPPFDDLQTQPRDFAIATEALCWQPDQELPDGVLAGLASALRLGAAGIFSAMEQTLMVVPDFGNNCLWFVDLAPGGNGASRLLWDDVTLLLRLVRLVGHIVLECPCEDGFAAASDPHGAQPSPAPTWALGGSEDGCGRCLKIAGPRFLIGDGQQAPTPSKRQTLAWLLDRGFLPPSAPRHIEEKYGTGITDTFRYQGRSDGSRREIRGIIRRIFSDRLGLDLDDTELPGCQWLGNDQVQKGVLGQYSAKDNLFAIAKGLREWRGLQVYGHEFFHVLQVRLAGLMSPTLIEPSLPQGGKLFIEGAAVWAESHILDAFAIRGMLSAVSLRQGDEYGEGFQLFKWIEEHLGGVPAAMSFLATGDIATVSGGSIPDLPHLYAHCGIAEALRAGR